jgi:hypothetical protein
MKDFLQPDGNNLGGILRFRFIPVADVQSFPLPINGMITEPLTIKTGKQWYCGYSTLEKTRYTEPDDSTNGGVVFKKTFAGFYPKDQEEMSVLFNSMRHDRFLIDYTDSNKIRKLVGTLQEPLQFSSNLNTGEKLVDLAGHSFRFFGDGTAKSFIYDI